MPDTIAPSDDAHAILRDVFGHDAFRPGQEEIVRAVAAGENALAIMPTGGGKSLCFQLPALLRPGVTVVVSPLIALMRDQVRALRAMGVEAHALTSANTSEETDAVWQALESGALKLLYLAPERLASGGAQRMLQRAGVGLIAVDEAHCVSQWGHDFRPDYLRIGDLRRALDVPLAAFTATADAETRDEIVESSSTAARRASSCAASTGPTSTWPSRPRTGRAARSSSSPMRAAAAPASSTAARAPRPRRWRRRCATRATPRPTTTARWTPRSAATSRPASAARTG